MWPVVFFAIFLLACLGVIPLGIPGLWVMLLGALLFNLVLDPAPIGLWALVGGGLLASLAELVEFLLAGRFARRFGGSKRAEWGAILGGLAGVLIGVPIPLIGSIIGGFLGAFGGALIGEWSLHQDKDRAGRAAWGALLGRAAAIGVKVAIGFAIAVWLVVDAALGPAKTVPLPPPAEAACPVGRA